MLKCVISFLILFEVSAMDAPFQAVIEGATSATAPAALLESLRKIRDTSSVADAFLSRYGGEDFKEEAGFITKTFNDEVKVKVDGAAQFLGQIFYKKGSESWDDDGSLALAQRLLKKEDSSFIRRDVSPTFFKERLEHMRLDRVNFSAWFNALTDHVNKIQAEKISEEELTTIRVALGE